MTPYLQDADVTLYHGDVLEVLREMEAESVDCVVSSPPYWGLRDYGTGAWEGGHHKWCSWWPDNPETGLGGARRCSCDGMTECDHLRAEGQRQDVGRVQVDGFHGSTKESVLKERPYERECRKCGATRIDQQLGLEPTPELYVERMVEVFREVRRVLASHGTVWLNLGDSYNAYNGGAGPSSKLSQTQSEQRPRLETGFGLQCKSLKPKDLVGIPWRVAFALQADGWYLRSDIIWSKPNPMPESVTDRPTKAHEYVFLLSKQPRYFFDQEAVREAHSPNTHTGNVNGQRSPVMDIKERMGGPMGQTSALATKILNPSGRNIRSVWEIATQPYPNAHFATFPEELARRCIAAGCPEQVCRVCGKARERVVELGEPRRLGHGQAAHRETAKWSEVQQGGVATSGLVTNQTRDKTTVGFTECGHWQGPDKENWTPDYRPGIVLDPFMGSGTVAHVARKLGRRSVGIDLSVEYLALAARRLQQQSLFALDNGAERTELEPVPERRGVKSDYSELQR